MAATILGIFTNKSNAEDAINKLEKNGYSPKDMSIVMKDVEEGQALAHDTGASVSSGTASGATTGAVIGGIAGLLIGIGAIAIPGVGALLIGGPIAAALGLSGAAATTASGAVTGAVAGGLVGALTGLGVPEEDARVYEERIKAGAILLAVPAHSDNESDVKEILEDTGAEKVRSVSMDSTTHAHAM